MDKNMSGLTLHLKVPWFWPDPQISSRNPSLLIKSRDTQEAWETPWPPQPWKESIAFQRFLPFGLGCIYDMGVEFLGISWGLKYFCTLPPNGQRGSTLAPVTPSDTAPWRWMLDLSLGWEDVFFFFFSENVDCRYWNLPSWELTYPLKSPFWRWCSFSPRGIC